MSRTLRRCIARQVIEARSHTGLRVCDFARMLKVEARTVTRWEAGDRVPSLTDLCRIATYSGVPLTKLLYDVCEKRAQIAKEAGDASR